MGNPAPVYRGLPKMTRSTERLEAVHAWEGCAPFVQGDYVVYL